MMRVFKFGGASVKNADAVRNVGQIVKMYEGEPLLMVVSAMGKTTNALEALTQAYMDRKREEVALIFEQVRSFHQDIISQLLLYPESHAYDDIDNLFIELECMIETEPEGSFDYNYDQIVSFGEIFSSRIVHTYLKEAGIVNRWMDARNFVQTGNTYRDATVDWPITQDLIAKKLKPIVLRQVVITQGFIGQSRDKQTVTLGREGSDYSAAIFAYGLDADTLTIWKDVAGVMNADPKRFEDAVLVSELSYDVAIELAYYGATVIHPKTIQPLKSKHVPLFVKSFLNPQAEGTKVSETAIDNHEQVFYIVKEKQAMLELSTKDFSFIVEEHLSRVFALLSQLRIGVNMMQNSAISFHFVVNEEPEKLQDLIKELRTWFEVAYIGGAQLVTIRNYQPEVAIKMKHNRTCLLEQRNGRVLQLLLT